ncbi:MAG: DUF3298 domain-containing protein [Lachnospiraceae bacterium]|nr:DUF3298 domain-containing protein [Lachnospiraceae bacterium]
MFYFQPYEIASYPMGVPEIIVPYEEFQMKIVLE